MASKSAVLTSAFNMQFEELVADILRIFPDNIDVQAAKNSFAMARKLNPRIISTIWHKHVSVPYAAKIDEGDLGYFLDKDYNADLAAAASSGASSGGASEKIAAGIARLREPIREMGHSNQQQVLKYLQNLTKITTMMNAET